MDAVKLIPEIKRPVWGGNKIATWGKPNCSGNIGETWELSFLESGASIIADGERKGERLVDVVTKAEWGSACARFDKFPVLVKFIDAASDLSVQVHPTDDYAKEKGLIAGKTEAWYILEAEKGAGIYLGFNRDVTAEDVKRAAANGRVTELLNFIPVKEGECYFVRSGNVHAIGAGVTVAEVQQSSDVTFRVYDYGRLGADGKPRELHLDSALDVMNFQKYEPEVVNETEGSLKSKKRLNKLAECEYFSFYEGAGSNEITSKSSFLCVICVKGVGSIDGKELKKGDTFFVPAASKVKIDGDARYLIAGVGI